MSDHVCINESRRAIQNKSKRWTDCSLVWTKARGTRRTHHLSGGSRSMRYSKMHFLLFFFFSAFEEQVAAAPLSSISPSAPPPPWQTQTAAEKLEETARKLQQRLPASSAASPASPVSSAAAAPTSSAAAPTSSAAAPTTGSSSAAEPQVARPADAAAEDCDEPDVPLRPGEVRCKRQPIVGTAIAPEPAEGFAFFGGLSFVAYVLIFLILLCSCCYVRKKGCGCCVWLCCGGDFGKTILAVLRALFSCGSGSGGGSKGDKGKAKDRKKKREDHVEKGRRGERGGRGEDTSDDNEYVLGSDFEVAGEKDERARSGETSVVGSPVRGAGRRADAKRGRDRGTQKNKKQRSEEQGKSADRKKAKSKQNRRRNEARRKVVDEEDSSSSRNSEQPQLSVTSSADPLPTLLGSPKRAKVMLKQTQTSKDVHQKRSKTKDEVKSRRRSAPRPPSRHSSECSSATVSPKHSGRCSESPSSADSDDSATTSPTRHQKSPSKEMSTRSSRQVVESVKSVKERERQAVDNKSRRSMKAPEKRRFAPTERSSDPTRRSGSRVGLKKGGARRPASPPTSDAEDGASLEQENVPEVVPADSRSTGKKAPKKYLALKEKRKRSIPARVLSPDPVPGRGRTGSGATTRAKAGKNNSTASGPRKDREKEKPKAVRKKPKPKPEAGPEAGERDVTSVQVTANIASASCRSRSERCGKGNEVQLHTGPRAKTKPKPASKKTGTNEKKNSGNRSTGRDGASKQETSRLSRKK